jgi:hypothetical protein
VRRRALLLVLAAGAAALGGCGGSDDDAREQVDAYVESANRVQQRYAPEFERANRAYTSFVRGGLGDAQAERDLGAAQDALRAARADVAALEPPPEARTLHGRLLRFFDVNLDLARETTRMAVYRPAAEAALAPLDRVNRRLDERLAGADAAPEQARALARFERSLERMVAALRGLEPPSVLKPTHGDQIRRLAATRGLAERLRRALLDEDAPEVARLIKRFRANAAARGSRRKLAARAVRRYDERYKRLTEAYADVQREQARLDRALPQ